MNEYEALLEFASTSRQLEVIKSLMKTNSQRKTGKEVGLAQTNISRMLKTVRKRQNAAGKGKHFIAMNNLKDTGLTVKGTSTLYKDGEPSIQWVKTDRESEDKLLAIKEAIENMVAEIVPAKKTTKPKLNIDDELINVYISNDLHFGAYMWGEETLDRDYDLKIAEEQLNTSIEYLVDNSPTTKTAIIADLGDTLEGDDFKNATPGHGHTLDVDGRY